MSLSVTSFLIAALTLLSTTLAPAELLVEENFAYPAGAFLHNQTGGAGWMGAWAEAGMQSNYDVIAAGSLAYDFLDVTGNSLQSRAPTSFSTDLSRFLATPISGTEGRVVWISFLLRKDSNGAEATPGHYFGLALYPSNAESQALFIGDPGETDFYSLGIAGSAEGQVASAHTSAVSETATFLAVKITFAGGNDVVELFVNPDPSAPAPATASATKSDLDIPDIASLGVLAGLDAQWTADEIRIGGTFADVAPPPTARPDFNGDGESDYVLVNPSTGRTAVWYLNNNLFTAGVYGPELPAGWRIIDAADFDGDGKQDLALFNASTRRTAIWYLSAASLLRGAFGPTIASGYQPIAVADFNNDEKPDFLLHNSSTRRTAIWFLNDNVLVSGAFGPTLPAGWSLVDAIDFDRDGHPDYLLSEASTRRTAIWYLSGPGFARSAFGPTIAAGYALLGAADFNRDSRPDYVLYNASTRRTAHWYLNDNVLLGGLFGPTLASGFTLAVP